MKHIVCFSGGKDSTALLMKMVERDMVIDDVVFADTGCEFPEMYEFLETVEQRFGFKITRVKPKKTFEQYFYQKRKTGKNVGSIPGWPMTIGAWCNDRLKVNPLKKYQRSQGQHIAYIGIAADEHKRHKRIKSNGKALLYELGITTKQAKRYVKRNGLLNPLYEKFDRLGCYFCPKQCLGSLKIVRSDYPELWQHMMDLDLDSPVPFKPGYTLATLEKRFANEDWWSRNQMTIYEMVAK